LVPNWHGELAIIVVVVVVIIRRLVVVIMIIIVIIRLVKVIVIIIITGPLPRRELRRQCQRNVRITEDAVVKPRVPRQDIVRNASGTTQLGKEVYRLGMRGAILGTQGIRGAILGAILGMQGMCRQAAARKGRANVVASGALRRVFSS